MLKFILFIIFFPIAFPIWLISKFFGWLFDTKNPNFLDEYDNEVEKRNRYNNSKKNAKLEREMDMLRLEPWQKDLVRKGEFDPENFEEDDDDLEEDDYYYEDS